MSPKATQGWLYPARQSTKQPTEYYQVQHNREGQLRPLWKAHDKKDSDNEHPSLTLIKGASTLIY